jgi:hypothetical protein
LFKDSPSQKRRDHRREYHISIVDMMRRMTAANPLHNAFLPADAPMALA